MRHSHRREGHSSHHYHQPYHDRPRERDPRLAHDRPRERDSRHGHDRSRERDPGLPHDRSRERDPGLPHDRSNDPRPANRADRYMGIQHGQYDGRWSYAPPIWHNEFINGYASRVAPSARNPNSYSYGYLTHHTVYTSRPQAVHNEARPPHTQQHQETCGDPIRVKMTKLPFFEVVGTPLQTKIERTDWNKMYSSKFIIEKSLLQHLRNKNTTDSYQVQLRFGKDESCEQKDYFPSELRVYVNGQLCLVPGWNTIPKGPAGPIDITSKCDFRKIDNTLEVRSPHESIVAVIHVTKRLTHEDLIKKLLAKAPIDPSATVAKIKEKLQEDPVNGVDITMTSLHFSLTCPVSKARMKLPCRASTCQHLHCFDAAYYLKMNEKKPSWICPVCSNIIEYDNLQIDEHFKNILEQNISNDKILLQADGSWKPFQPKDVNTSILTLDDTLDHSTVNGKEPHPAGDKNCPNDDTENAQHITIDLLSEDDSSELENADYTSSKGLQNDRDEVVILSDDESPGSLADEMLPPLPSPSSWRPVDTEATSTPKPCDTSIGDLEGPVNFALMPSKRTSSWKITNGNASNTPKSRRKSRCRRWERIGERTPKRASVVIATTTAAATTTTNSPGTNTNTSTGNIEIDFIPL